MFLESLKVIFLGIVEGITEWLPISSTGHMILVDEFIHLDVSNDFLQLFFVVIQLGAIMAVIITYWNKLWPFSRKKTKATRRATLSLWAKVIIGSIPPALLGLVLDDWMTEHLHNGIAVAIVLIVYGIAFILVERRNRKRAALVAAGELVVRERSLPKHSERNALSLNDEEDESAAYSDVRNFEELSYRHSLLIGFFESLSIVPGTSRSGAIILGSMLTGLSRTVATEFAFFLAIPIMFGWSGIKLLKFCVNYSAATGITFNHFAPTEIYFLVLGCVVAFIVSMFAIRFLINYIKKNDFTVFGWYRIVLGIVVLAYFIFI